MRVLPGITATMRGVRVDAQCRVLSRDGVPLPGLLAAGDVVGVHGGPRGGYLGGLAVALISGYLCGAAAA
jgi:fumarate reductase flavoprotein subunit